MKLEEEVRAAMAPLTGEADRLVLKRAALREYERARKMAAELGLELDEALQKLRTIKTMEAKAGCRVEEAFQFWVPHHNSAKHEVPVTELVSLFIKSRETAGNSIVDLRDLKTHLGWFAGKFTCPLAHVTADDYDEFFASFQVAPTTLKHYRGSVSRLVNWAKASRYVPDIYPGVPEYPSKAKRKRLRKPLLTMEDRDKMFVCSKEKEKPAALIAAYAPCRSCELDRAHFEDINWSNSTLTIYADDAKTGVTRFVYLVPKLMKLLEQYRGRAGKIYPHKSVSRMWPNLAERAGISWPKNGWRKAVLSYLLAFTQNEAGVAAQGGTSVKELRNTYVTTVDFSLGAEWFGLGASDYHPARPVCLQVGASSPQLSNPEQPGKCEMNILTLPVAYVAQR
ncbi:MAG TPA: hypothetical protein VJA21_19435 [Verrucomicrobiae bacterium]